jgi:formylglycine-generating enzyme required for sulfatase activity
MHRSEPEEHLTRINLLDNKLYETVAPIFVDPDFDDFFDPNCIGTTQSCRPRRRDRFRRPPSFAPKVTTKLFSPGELIRDCGSCPDMVVIPGGSFVMGSNLQERELARKAGVDEKFTSWEGPQHPVRIPSFAAGRQAVTREQFSAFVDATRYVTDAEQGDGC